MQRRGGGNGEFSVGDRAQRRVFDVDQLDRVLGEIAVFRDDGDHGFPDIAHLLRRQRQNRRRVIVRHPRNRNHRPVVARDIVGGEDRDDAGCCPRSFDIDPHDIRMRLFAAAERDVKRAIRLAIGGVFAVAGQ